MKDPDWLIQKLEAVLHSFTDDSFPPTQDQNKKFSDFVDVLKQDNTTLNALTQPTRTRRVKARDLLQDVYRSLSREVFILCILAGTVTSLADVKKGGIIQALSTWWKGVPHPQGLRDLATDLCNRYEIDRLVFGHDVNDAEPSEIRKRGHDLVEPEDGDIVNDPSSRQEQLSEPLRQEQPLMLSRQEQLLRLSNLPGSPDEYCFFEIIPRNNMDSFPEPFRTGFKKSELVKERGEGVDIADSFFMAVAKDKEKDGVILMRSGFQFLFDIAQNLN